MGADTKIEWTHHTFNPWRGCAKVSPGCANCYAEALAKRTGIHGTWGPNGERVVSSDAYWRQPLRWSRAAAKAGERRRVFCASMADVFEDRPDLVEPRRRLMMLMLDTPHLDWLLLTKRPENIARLMDWSVLGCFDADEWPANAWIGATAEDQQRADERIPHLLAVPAAVRFLSVEPLLGPVDLRPWLPPSVVVAMKYEHDTGRTWEQDHARINWAIVGGESGPGARPMHPAWARSVRDQCREAGVPFFFKQEGAWTKRRPSNYCAVTRRRYSHESVALFEDGTQYRADQPDEWGTRGMETLYRHGGHNGDLSLFPEDLRVREFPVRDGGNNDAR